MKIRPHVFSGEADGEDVEGLLLHFEGVCVASGIFDYAQRIVLLTVSMEGEAERWACARGRWLQAKRRQWDDVKLEFIERFTDMT